MHVHGKTTRLKPNTNLAYNEQTKQANMEVETYKHEIKQVRKILYK